MLFSATWVTSENGVAEFFNGIGAKPPTEPAQRLVRFPSDVKWGGCVSSRCFCPLDEVRRVCLSLQHSPDLGDSPTTGVLNTKLRAT